MARIAAGQSVGKRPHLMGCQLSAPTCRHWLGAESRYCGAPVGVRPYLPGPRCPLHTPAALAGHPEPPADPPRSRWWIRPDGSVVPPPPLGASRLVDDRAVASGKRRSSPDRYAAARAAETERRERERQARRGHLTAVPDDPGHGAARGIASPGHLTDARPSPKTRSADDSTESRQQR